MHLEDLKTALENVIESDGRPVVVFSAIWPILRAAKLKPEDTCNEIIKILEELPNSPTILMPTFTNGFNNGECNLDTEPSSTGALTEFFRVKENTRRTACPFFPFSASGSKANEIFQLRPKDAWGEGSLYEWIYNENAEIVTIGTHPTHCSFTHYAEWLLKEKIPYRFSKEFSGKVIHEGKEEDLSTSLYVRKYEPAPAINDFTFLLNDFVSAGMKIETVDGIAVSAIDAKAKINVALQAMDKDNLALITNKDDFRN